MNKTNIIGAIAVIALVLAGWALLKSPKAESLASFGANASNIPAAGAALPNGVILPNPSNFDYLTTNSLAYLGKAIGFGNSTSVPTYQQTVRQTLTAATTTPCALQNPFTSTSTYLAVLNVTTSTSSAASIIAAISTSPNATTTAIGNAQAIAANALATLETDGIASTTGAGVLVGPSQYVVWGTTAASAVGYGYTFGGTCTATFTTAN